MADNHGMNPRRRTPGRDAIVVALLILTTIALTLSADRAEAASPRIVEQAFAIGFAFSADRDVAVCPSALERVRIVERPGGHADAAGAVADGLGGCSIELQADLVREAARERYRPGRGGDSARLTICATIAHELWHTAGVVHTETGLMAPTGGPAPWDCLVWVSRLERSELRASRARARR